MRPWAILSAAALALVVSGCSYVYARATYDFHPYPGSPQVLYELGAEDLAGLAAGAFGPGIETVEQRQYLPFKDKAAIRVYVFNDRKHYAAFSRTSILTRGSSTTDEVYLSEKLRERPATLPNILVHELSHVHIRRYTGTLRYVSDVPSWFAEGMAVWVSAGGGAENVTPQDALAAIRRGIRFARKESGSLFGAFGESSNGLEPHMYYRQASLFVEYLHQSRPDDFRAAFVGILRGERFRDAWPAHYGRSISDLWADFVADRKLARVFDLLKPALGRRVNAPRR